MKAVSRLVDVGDALLRVRHLLGGIVSEAGKVDFGKVARGERGTDLSRAALMDYHYPCSPITRRTELIDGHEVDLIAKCLANRGACGRPARCR